MSPDWYPVKPIWQGTEQCVLEQKDLLLSLPRLWRMMLLSDGSVTRHLELLLGEQVTVDCVEMRGIGHALLGLPPGTALVPGPRVQRQVHLKPASDEVLVYAASWWAAEEVKSALPAVQQPVWKTLQQQRTELFRSLERLYYGSSPHLERAHGADAAGSGSPEADFRRFSVRVVEGLRLVILRHDGVLQCSALPTAARATSSSQPWRQEPLLQALCLAARHPSSPFYNPSSPLTTPPQPPQARWDSAVPCRQQHGRPLPPCLRGRRCCCRHRALAHHQGEVSAAALRARPGGWVGTGEGGYSGRWVLEKVCTGEACAVAAGTGAWHTTRGKFLLLHCVRGQVGTGEGWYQTGQLRVGAGDGGCWGRWFLGKVVAGEGGCWGKVGTGEGGCQGRWVPGKVGTGRYWGRWLGAAFPPCSLSRPSPSPLPPPSLLLSIFNPPNPPPSLFQTTLPPDQQPAPFHLSEVVRNYNMRVAPSPPCPLSPHTPDQQPGSLHQESPAASWSFRPHAHSALPPLRGGAQLQHALRSLFPPQEQISNRVLCIKNHLLLAGLLSRTLIVPFHHSEVVRNYNMHVALDVEHLRRCFGKVVFTTAEYRRKYVKPINVTEVVCWHGPKGACREEDKELLLNCPAPETMNTPASVLVGGDGEALRKIGKPGFVFNTRVRITRTLFRGQLTQLTGNHTALAACLPMSATKSQVLEAYGNNQSPVLVVGDLVNVHFTQWPESDAALDLPFERSSVCPTALLIKPAAGMFLAAELFVRKTFKGERFIGMHWRRGSAALQAAAGMFLAAERFVRDTFQRERFVGMHWRRGDLKAYCFWHGRNNACYFPVQQVGGLAVLQGFQPCLGCES
ncbi:unnamed protein product [Closterium sp. NIES-64]|nr:unnamed protein product [Closterium sp. NIES-64]